MEIAGFIIILGWIANIIAVIWTIVDVLKSDFKDTLTKVIWIAVAIFLGLLGAIIYYFVGTKQKVIIEEK